MTNATDYPGYRFAGEALLDLLGDRLTVTIEAGYLDEDGLLADRAVVEQHELDTSMTAIHPDRLFDTLTDTLRGLLPDWEWEVAVEQVDADAFSYSLFLGGMRTCREVPTAEVTTDPLVEAYLEAVAVVDEMPWSPNNQGRTFTESRAFTTADHAVRDAFDALLPENLRGLRLHRDENTVNEFVWLPLLVAEHNGDAHAAATAWARGERPAQHPAGKAVAA